MLTTTLNQIFEYEPCPKGWRRLLESLNKTAPDDEELIFLYILESNGLEDAVWALKSVEYRDYCLFLADVAEYKLPIYEAVGTSEAPRKAILAIRKWYRKQITNKGLEDARVYANIASNDMHKSLVYEHMHTGVKNLAMADAWSVAQVVVRAARPWTSADWFLDEAMSTGSSRVFQDIEDMFINSLCSE